jgi:hypothetical protein
MFAINHAATALLIKKRFPTVRLAWLLISVQLVEMIWVALNFVGVERTTTEASVTSVRDIHLAYMPYSHSVVSSLVIAAVAWALFRGAKMQRAAIAIAIGILSHLVLDLLTHVRDIAVLPFALDLRVGTGLYSIPVAAFFVELGYGLLCWWLFKGGRALLVTIVAFNLANLSLFLPAIRGPETLMAGHPLWVVSTVAVQIVVTLVLIWRFAREGTRVSPATGS